MTDTDTAIVEVYGKLSNPSAMEDVEKRLETKAETAEKRASDAEDIGMTGLATQDRDKVLHLRTIGWCEAHGLQPLTDDELSVWQAWLPTEYTSWDNGERRDWARYRYFEGVPASVRARIKEALSLFSVLEIRTPERQPRPMFDPILLGHIDHPNGVRDTVLLARWGESDANFLSFENIKAIVAARTGLFAGKGESMRAEERIMNGSLGFMAGAVLGMVVGLVISFVMAMFGMDKEATSLSFVLSMGLGASIVPLVMVFDSLWVRWKKHHLRTTNPDIAHAV